MDHDQLREHLRFAAELGVGGASRDPVWRARARRGDTVVDVKLAAGEPELIAVSKNAAEALAAIQIEIGADCSRCKLHTLGRKQVVFGVGNPNAELMFVGEAPGADEDLQGIPF